MGQVDILEAGEHRANSGLRQALLRSCSGQRTFVSDSLSADVGVLSIGPNGSLNQPAPGVLCEASSSDRKNTLSVSV